MRELYYVGSTCYGIYCGDPELKSEVSLNVDLGLKGSLGPVVLEAYLFNNMIQNLISAEEAEEGLDECEFVFTNTAKARLLGGEAKISVRIPLMAQNKMLLIPSVTGAYVRAKDRETGEPIAAIPPLNIKGRVRLQGYADGVLGYFVQFNTHYAAKQDRISPVYGELPTPYWITFGADAGVTFGRFLFFESGKLGVRVTNIADKKYRNHLARADAIGRNVKTMLSLKF